MSDVPTIFDLHSRICELEAKVAELEQRLPAVEEPVDHNLTGEIKVGDRLIWEPTNPRAFMSVMVAEINGDSICLRDMKGQYHWNEESRVREACIRSEL